MLRSATAKGLLGAICAVVALGCDGKPEPITNEALRLAVRGYLAADLGDLVQKTDERARWYADFPERIRLPGIDVYLESSAGSPATSASVRTDLSGRFTLFAPGSGQYKLCWRSSVYGGGCTDPFLAVGNRALFVSTVSIVIPTKAGFSALVGKVTDERGDSVRTFEPYLNINSYATVTMESKGAADVEVYVNDDGYYLLPYVPAKTALTITARIEGGKRVQPIVPEAGLGSTPVDPLNLRIQNHPPQLEPLRALHGGTRVQNVPPGSKIGLRAASRDKDGDAVKLRWSVGEGAGSLSATTGDAVSWVLPAGSGGRYTATAVAHDGKGGYDIETVTVLADGKDVPFSGIVVDTQGNPQKDADIEIVHGSTTTTAVTGPSGRFAVRADMAGRYVLNVRKKGYALNSRIYDRAITGGRWILQSAQKVTIDPKTGGTFTDPRENKRECVGPASARARTGPANDSVRIAEWQDGRGEPIDPPSKEGSQRQPVADPANLTKLPPCGPGVSVKIPPAAFEKAGAEVTTPFDAYVSTVDLLSPQQMPGDAGVVSDDGGWFESFGAGALDLPNGVELKNGVKAEVFIPIDRSRQGETPPDTIPLLSYDATAGRWKDEGTLMLDTLGGVVGYRGEVEHFSTFNADNVKDETSACVRVFSGDLPTDYDLEVAAPLGGTGNIKILNKPIDQNTGTEHAIYNLPNNTNITLAPMTQDADPQLLGYYVVNSGPPQNPNTSPNPPAGPPYDGSVDPNSGACNAFVVMRIGSAPELPFGNEYLHGLGFLAAVNLGFDPLDFAGPTGNALKDAVVDASKSYYDQVDPCGTGAPPPACGADDRRTLQGFKDTNGFPAGEITAQFANTGDLGFGRDMHCRVTDGGNGYVACYVANYGTGYVATPGGAGTPDADDANAAGFRATVGNSAEVATVAMEYAPIEGDTSGEPLVKFFVYKKDFPGPGDYDIAISANLDGLGERPVPQLCMICHGGLAPPPGASGAPVWNDADSVKMDSRFLPFDHRLYTFPDDPSLALTVNDQEASIKSLNEDVVDRVPTGAPVDDPIRALLSALYGGGATQIFDATPTGWNPGDSANAPGQENFYDNVVANACRPCHVAQPFEQLQFKESDTLLNVDANTFGASGDYLMLGTVQQRVCGEYTMPHSRRTHDIFWGNYVDIDPNIAGLSMYTELQTFGDAQLPAASNSWDHDLCTSFLSPQVQSPSLFYQQTIQPIFNGKCVACHVSGGAAGFMQLTDGQSYDSLLTGPPPRVVPGNDDPAAPGNTLLFRVDGKTMPPSCYEVGDPPNGNFPCLTDGQIDLLKVWIRNGAS